MSSSVKEHRTSPMILIASHHRTFRLICGMLLILSAASAVLPPAPSLAAPFKPFDEAAKDKSLVEFRQRLLAAAESRDFQRLEPFLSPNVQLSFGGQFGITDAKTMFAEQPDLWDELARLLRRGGRFNTDSASGTRMFVAPYTFFAEPPPGLDVFEYVIVTGDKVPVRAEPAADSPVIGQLGYETVATDNDGTSDDEWQRVKLPNGKAGYVERQYAATAADYRAGFQKLDGQWKMVFFLAGD